jgi:hypothetical protein
LLNVLLCDVYLTYLPFLAHDFGHAQGGEKQSKENQMRLGARFDKRSEA